jgi:hypothetical protein
MKLTRWLVPILLLLAGCAVLQPDASNVGIGKQFIAAHHRVGLAAGLTPCNTGSGPNSGNGDPLRTCFTDLNSNDAMLAAMFGVSGLLVGQGPVPTPMRVATSADIVALWGCTSSPSIFMASNGTCQSGGGGGGSVSTTGAPASGNLTVFSSGSTITSGNLSGDCTTSSTLAITCTKTGGVSFAPSATIDTTTANNIGSGTLASARLPGTIAANTSGNAATATAFASAPAQCTAGQFATGINASGTALCSTLTGSPNIQTAPTYTTTLADCNATIQYNNSATSTYTIAANSSVACPVNSQMTIVNLGTSGAMQITSADTLKLVPTGTNAPITLTPFGIAQLKKINATTWFVSGGSSGTSSGTTLLAYIKTLGINKAGVLTGQTLSPFSSTPLDAINTTITTWAGNPTVGIGSSQIASGYLPAIIDVFAACVGNIIGITNIGGGGCNIEDGQNTTANSWLAMAQGAQAKNLIVKINYIPNNPAGCGNNPWTLVGGIPAVLVSGQTANTTFVGWLDQLATYLKTLTQPFIIDGPGELNLGGGISCAAQAASQNWMGVNAASTGVPSSAQVAAVFQLMYNRLAADGVTEALWNFEYASGTATTVDQSSDGFGFPGTSYVDVVSIDSQPASYTNASDYLWAQQSPQNTLPFFIGSMVNVSGASAFTVNTYASSNGLLGYMISNADGVNGYPASFGIVEWPQGNSYNQQNNAVSALSGPTLAGSANYFNNTNLPVGGFSGPK